jgi:hypothetical protein
MPMAPDAEIYCPLCEYRPHHEDRWVCKPACGTSWNTFWTRGVCPGCGHLWQVTQCPACHRRSPHEGWYHYPHEPEAAEREETLAPAEARASIAGGVCGAANLTL